MNNDELIGAAVVAASLFTIAITGFAFYERWPEVYSILMTK